MSIPSVPSVAVLAFCVFACSDGEPVSTSKHEAVTDKSVYAPGDSILITLRVTNKTAVIWWCPLRLQHWNDAGRWVYANDDGLDCRTPLPVASDVRPKFAPYRLPMDLPEGQYRLHNEFSSIVTPPFTVKRS